MPLTHISGVAVSVLRNHAPPLRELSAVTGGHVLEVLGHPQGQVVLVQDLGIGLPELSELFHKLIVAQHGVGVVRGVIDDSAETELSG